MNNIIQFGKHDGETFEWIFFNHPHYARYINQKGMANHDYFGEEEGEYFLELYRRAKSLTGTCTQRKQRPIEYLGLTFHGDGTRLGSIGYYCQECDYLGGSPADYYPASFFAYECDLSWAEQRRIAKEVKRAYIGRGNLTQAKMEAFFHNDANFRDCTPGFFKDMKALL
jgi:hypothetical protein